MANRIGGGVPRRRQSLKCSLILWLRCSINSCVNVHAGAALPRCNRRTSSGEHHLRGHSCLGRRVPTATRLGFRLLIPVACFAALGVVLALLPWLRWALD